MKATKKIDQLVLQALAHRYLYYVKSTPIISDREYDKLEEEALTKSGKKLLETPGSSLESSYSDEVKQLALSMKNIN